MDPSIRRYRCVPPKDLQNLSPDQIETIRRLAREDPEEGVVETGHDSLDGYAAPGM
ncbi:hypothetical protein HK105_206130 [Polyrhizophydium stewartii]|uniref:Uncharacterized protein n=1 Tax=Polyrhizophydium stewartii TaxID=2732419 RepID=A0ABR4N4D8_9FUNG